MICLELAAVFCSGASAHSFDTTIGVGCRSNLCDSPGFAVGLEHEVQGTIRKGAEWMVAWSQVKVPVFTVLMRRSFGVGGSVAA